MTRIAWVFLWVFVFSIPWEKSVWVPSVGTISRLLGLAAFAAGAVAAAQRRSLRLPNLALGWAALFVAWSALTWFWSLDQAATATRIRTLVELLAMFWLVWDSCRGPERQKQLLKAYLWGAVLAASFAFWRYAHHEQTYWRRYAAAGFDPNDFGLIMALAIPMALYLSYRQRGGMRWLYVASALVLIVAVFLTASRTALVVTFATFLFAIGTWRRADPAQRWVTVGLVGVVALGLVQFAPAPQRDRLATITTELRKGTFHDRTRIWKTGLKVFKSHAVAGVGSGAYPKAVEPWLGRPADFQYVAHNTFLSVLVETGTIGFIIFAGLMATLLLFIWAMEWPERALWGTVLIAWAVGVSTLTWEQYKPTWLIMALIATDWARACWARESTCYRMDMGNRTSIPVEEQRR